MDVRVEICGAAFVWDEQKAASNAAKHGVRFEDAAHVFFDPFLRMVDAGRNHEARDAVIGYDNTSRLLLVVHIEVQQGALRIISARGVDSRERQLYEQ